MKIIQIHTHAHKDQILGLGDDGAIYERDYDWVDGKGTVYYWKPQNWVSHHEALIDLAKETPDYEESKYPGHRTASVHKRAGYYLVVYREDGKAVAVSSTKREDSTQACITWWEAVGELPSYATTRFDMEEVEP